MYFLNEQLENNSKFPLKKTRIFLPEAYIWLLEVWFWLQGARRGNGSKYLGLGLYKGPEFLGEVPSRVDRSGVDRSGVQFVQMFATCSAIISGDIK